MKRSPQQPTTDTTRDCCGAGAARDFYSTEGTIRTLGDSLCPGACDAHSSCPFRIAPGTGTTRLPISCPSSQSEKGTGPAAKGFPHLTQCFSGSLSGCGQAGGTVMEGNICHNKNQKVQPKEPKSQGICLRLLVKLYGFLARRTNCTFK